MRKTEKVLAPQICLIAVSAKRFRRYWRLLGKPRFTELRSTVTRLLDARHRAWRFHVLDAAACRWLRQRLPVENAGKIPAMLAAADALIMATWLPNAGFQRYRWVMSQDLLLTLANVEHIAAASGCDSELAVGCDARSIANYWSSGGVLRLPEVFQLLEIPTDQILLGAIFLFPKEIGDSELAVSKLRPLRTPWHDWTRGVQ